MAGTKETVQGYVVDLACLRSYPQMELLDRASRHSKDCALMGHCIESGYGLVDATGRLTILDSEATGKITEILKRTDTKEGTYLRAEREIDGHKMKTLRVEEVIPEPLPS